MARSTVAASRPRGISQDPGAMATKSTPPVDWRRILPRLASLKITVVLFVLAMILVLAGTLAQVEKDVWQVVEEYFRTAWTWIDLRVFFPPSFFPGLVLPSKLMLPGRFEVSLGTYFPGGWLIGGLLMINLMAAHLVRFPITARGSRFRTGGVITLIGLVLMGVLIAKGSATTNLEGGQTLSAASTYRALQLGLGAIVVAAVVLFRRLGPEQKVGRWGLPVLGLAAAGALVWSMTGGAPRLGESSLRILGEMLAGQVATLVMLAGLAFLYGRRAGVVLLHGGIALIMLGEVVTGLTAVEGQMRLVEGQSASYVQDTRKLELAVIDHKDPSLDSVVVVPGSRLQTGSRIEDPALPFDIDIARYLVNSDIRKAEPSEPSLADRGVGKSWVADPARPVSGTENGRVNLPAAYVTLLRKGSNQPLGTYLVGLAISELGFADEVNVDGHHYDIALRSKRTYKPYQLRLIDVQKEDYPGTTVPRHYASIVQLQEPSTNVDREVNIWMNNPLRFGGDTFYQSGYYKDPRSGEETSTLAVVSNGGRMIPYIACMVVATGLLAHFLILLTRFVSRRSQPARVIAADVAGGGPKGLPLRWIVPGLVVLCGVWLASKALPPAAPADGMPVYEVGRLPVLDHGRFKPIDTLARTSLQVLSGRQTYKDKAGESQPAIRWLMNLMARPDAASAEKVFRIEHPEVLDTLGLTSREGFRYALDEFRGRLDELDRQVRLALSVETSALSTYQKKILEVDRKLGTWNSLVRAFARDPAGGAPNAFIPGGGISDMPEPPLVVPSEATGKTYRMLTRGPAGEPGEVEEDAQGRQAGSLFAAMLESYGAGKAEGVRDNLHKYEQLLQSMPATAAALGKVRYEAFFNNFQPLYYAAVVYVGAFLCAVAAWLGWSRVFNRASLGLIVAAFLLHMFVIGSRIYISGRPPVTNLYSSAVFIGWAAVLFGIVLEVVYGLGVGNVIASVGGFLTLLIAHFLGADSDTFAVLQAVLDTQFWLATHVVCITLGYSATYVAGLLGVLYVIRAVLTPRFDENTAKDLARMIYGTVCFAIFFSFVGTVLGGLWADDSWGRFWGWDPKENGALIIVLWNVMVLHALKGGMVKQRGLAVLAVAGNITVSWSWFGVNELGIGLHSYGFTEGVLRSLVLFVGSQILIVLIGLLPERYWVSRWGRGRRETAGA